MSDDPVFRAVELALRREVLASRSLAQEVVTALHQGGLVLLPEDLTDEVLEVETAHIEAAVEAIVRKCVPAATTMMVEDAVFELAEFVKKRVIAARVEWLEVGEPDDETGQPEAAAGDRATEVVDVRDKARSETRGPR